MKEKSWHMHAMILAAAVSMLPAEAHAARSLIDLVLGEMQGYLFWLLYPPPALRWVYGILGAGCIVFGPAVYRFVVSLPGGLLLALIGAGIGAASGSQFFAIVGALIGFFVGLSIAWALHQLGIFIVGTWFGWLILSGIWSAVFDSRPGMIVAILAFLYGLFAVALSNLLIGVISSFIGALLITIAAGMHGNLWLLLGLTAVGVAVQSAIGRWGKGERKSESGGEAGQALGEVIKGLLAALFAIGLKIKTLLFDRRSKVVQAGGATMPADELPATDAPSALPYSGFWRRFAAISIDGLVMTIAGLLATLLAVFATGAHSFVDTGTLIFDNRLTPWYVVLASFFLFHAYRAAMESSFRQATLGKLALGLVATNLNGGRLSFGRALARTLLSAVSAITLGIGYLPHIFSSREQVAHDMAASALVLRGVREERRNGKDKRSFALGITLAMLVLLCGARMLQFYTMVAPYRSLASAENTRPQSVPEMVTTPPLKSAQLTVSSMAPVSDVPQVPASGVPQSGDGREGRFGDLWKMIRASAQRGDAEVRAIQAEIDAKPKTEHTNRKEARKLNQQGLEAYRAKLIGEAVSIFNAAHRADPRDQEIAGNLGLALLDAGRLKEAEVALMEALIIEPSRVGAWTVLGMVLAQQDDSSAALGALLNAHRFSKDQAKTLGYFAQLAESDLREPVRQAAGEALRQAGP